MNWVQFLREIGIRVDEDAAPALIKRMSIDAATLRAELTARGLRWDDPGDSQRPDGAELAKSAKHVIDASVRSSGLLGAASGVVGLAGVPPEAMARLIQSFRLAQRIAIIYGHDPATDRGRIHVRRALSAAWGFELPVQASEDIKLSQLPRVLDAGTLALHDGPAWLAKTLAKSATSAIGRRASRWIPGLGAGMGLLHGRKLARVQGEKMHDAIRRRWEGPRPKHVEDAVEITA